MKKVFSNKKVRLIAIMAIISIICIVFTYNDYFLYNTPILKITKIENVAKENSERYEQHITGIIQNGEYKGTEHSLVYKASKSGVIDEQIHESSELFIHLKKDGTVSSITNIKRDKYLVILLVLFVDLMILVGADKGYKTILTLIINIAISIIAVSIYIFNDLGIGILQLFIPISLLFIIFSLLICSGYNKKTFSAIVSSIVSLLVSFSISYIILRIYNDSIYYHTLDYVEVMKDYEGVFYLNILLSSLGAIMDIAITMSSSMNELIYNDNNISFKALRKSGEEISKDILGTMTNVILFSCYTSIIPIVLLAIKNMSTITDAINTYGQLEMIRVLTSCISIVLSIPISLYISLWILRKVKKDA